MNKIRKGDEVIVLAGRDKGKRGKVVLRKDDERVVVEGINQVKKHQRPSQQGGVPVPGGIVVQDAPLSASNVMIVCKSCSRPARVGVRVRSDGVKVRVCKRCNADID